MYELRLDLVATANLFKAGHRIRLDVSSSNYPRFDRNNTNTGGIIASGGEADFVEARVSRLDQGLGPQREGKPRVLN